MYIQKIKKLKKRKIFKIILYIIRKKCRNIRKDIADDYCTIHKIYTHISDDIKDRIKKEGLFIAIAYNIIIAWTMLVLMVGVLIVAYIRIFLNP